MGFLHEAKAGKRIGTPQFMPQTQWEDLKRIENVLHAGGFDYRKAA
jgi:hypothetical protein